MCQMPCVFAAVLTAATIAAAPAYAESPAPTRDIICGHIEAAAGVHDLPVAYLTRLIWRESSFRPGAVSPKGAQGIAQFMPATAAERGLSDPFDPKPAIAAAASFLTDLRSRFGNLGLAAAAYNGGPRRVADWLAGTGGLPYETRRFVRLVTGRPAGDWAGSGETESGGSPPRDGLDSARPVSCGDVVAAIARPARIVVAAGPSPTAPWGAQVAGHFSRERALSIYAALQRRHESVLAGRAPMVVGSRNRSRGPAVFYDVRVPAETKDEASAVCARLKAAGGGCIVRKS